MSLTPDEWRELDKAERAHVAAQAAYMAAAHAGSPTAAAWAKVERCSADYSFLLFTLGRRLIDAARPKCETCAESEDHRVWSPNAECAWTPCPDCDGTGWAQ